jgi:hypothetical protein
MEEFAAMDGPELKWSSFKEVPWEDVPGETWAAVREAGGYAAYLLRLSSFRVRWFRPETDEEAEYHKTHMRGADSVLHSTPPEPLAFADYPDTVWLRYALAPMICGRVVAHEARHLAQMAVYPRLRWRDTTTREELTWMEEDARAFEVQCIYSLNCQKASGRGGGVPY